MYRIENSWSFFQPGCENPLCNAVGINRYLVRLHHIMAKRAMDVASRELDREAAVHVQACRLRGFVPTGVAKDCRTVVIT